MNTVAASQLRTLAFGDVDGGIWGAALHAAAPALVLGDRTGTTSSSGVLQEGWSSDGPGWRLRGEGFDLHVEPSGEEMTQAEAADSGETVSGFQELCRVQGVVNLGGSERRIDCVGTRCVIDGVDAGSLGSARAVAGWFGDDDAFMLLSLRATEGVGQEADLIAATLFDPEGWVPVQDPRLSTTYTATGRPERTTLELWVGEGENEFPRRAAGEAAGDGGTYQAAGTDLRVVPLRCHSRGREGTGVYVLATFAAL
jgi:hypothetical protein